MVYSYPNGDINDWGSVDSAGISSWSALYNSESSWNIGALDQNVDPNNPFDVGWGVYNQNTHVISGDSIFIIKLMDDSYRKLRIDNMKSGVFNFTYANLDGSNEVHASVTKSNYNERLFGYYSLENELEVDHEPVTTDKWDLFFGKYTGFIPTPYNLTGIIAGPHTEVVRIDGVTDVVNYTDWSSASFTTEINTIGADWKEFNMGTMSYEIAEDRVYFVKTGAGDIWKVIPTGFGGSADGNFEFTKEKISALSTDKYGMPNAEVIIYPNPANEKISLLLNNMNSSSTTVQIMNLEGQIVFEQAYVEESNFEVKNIPVHSFRKGVYIIKVQSGNQHFNQKLIIK